MKFEIDYINKMVSEFLGFNITLNTFVSIEKDINKYLINLDTNKIKNMDNILRNESIFFILIVSKFIK